MKPSDLVKGDYYELCAKLGYDTRNIDWGRFKKQMLPLYKARIDEERISANRQEVSDPVIDGKSDAEIIKQRLSGKPKDPRDEIVLPLYYEILHNAALLNYVFPIECYCGPAPILSFNASVRRTTHGAVILIYDELLSFIYNVMKVFALSIQIAAHKSSEDGNPTIVQPQLSSADAACQLAALVSNFFSHGCSGPPPFGGLGGAVSDISIDLSLSTIRFVIAHECGHILAGHLTESAATVPESPMQRWLQEMSKEKSDAIFSKEFTREAAYKIAGDWDKENAADQYGMDLCLAPVWPMDGSIERFHDAAMRLAGPLIFFALQDFLTNALVRLVGGIEIEDLMTDHPPSAQRAEVMRGWIRQISVNADLLLYTGTLFVEWLNGVSDEAYKHLSLSQQ